MTYPAPEGLTIDADWRSRTGQGTWLFYVFGNRRLRPLRAQRSRRGPEWIVREAFDNQIHERWGLFTLYDRVVCGDAAYHTTEWLRLWLAHAIERWQVEAWFLPPQIWSAGRPTVTEMMPFYEGLARERGVRATAEGALPEVAAQQDSQYFTTYQGPGSDIPMPDDITSSEACDAVNCRSESVATAKPEVIAWFDKHLKKRETAQGNDRWEQDLGHEGGGGFLRGTTRVATLPKGTTVYRYYGPTQNASWVSRPLGRWCSPSPIEGDPRVESALPPENGAYKMVRGEITKECDVLIGLGAPRCSNKPGGPVQYLLPPSDAVDSTYSANAWLKLC